jgi:hypothetical protein
MFSIDTYSTRPEALDKSVRVSLANGGGESAEEIVARAQAFDDFLAGEWVKIGS